MGNEMGPFGHLDYQVGSKNFPNCQVGRGKEMRLSEGLMNSEESSDSTRSVEEWRFMWY
jgi:hypothetical protein